MCLSVWMYVAIDDGIGKLVACWMPVVSFVVCEYEHVIANIWVLNLGLLVGVPKISIISVYFFHLIPVLFGNLIG